jgi:hypothetical protein
MPTFKGFNKDESGQTLAVVDFPEARKFIPSMASGALQFIPHPNPHERQLTEDQFRNTFKVGFEVLPTSYPDGGFSLDAIAAAAEGKGPAQKGPVMVPGGQNNNM